MQNLERLALIQEFFLVNTQEEGELIPLHLCASIDLSEFAFTEDELQKLRHLLQRLELSLLDEFSKHWEAASVIVELRPKPTVLS